MTDEEDDAFDWGEAERRARMFDHLAEVMKRVQERKYIPIRIDKITRGIRFVVTTYSDGHDPLEFTMLDPVTGSVRVKDNFYFPEPTECVLVGSEDDLDGQGAMLDGVIKHNAKLVFRVNGERVQETGPELRVSSMAVWPSWPQACISPRLRERCGRSPCSSIRRASMSARSAIARPAEPRRSVPTTPTWPTPSATSSKPKLRSLSATNAAVRANSNPNSGWAWSSCRQAVISAATDGRVMLMRRLPSELAPRP